MRNTVNRKPVTLIPWRKTCLPVERRNRRTRSKTRKKFIAQITDIQDRHDALLAKLKAMESQKNKLAHEIEIIVKQFESSQVTIKDLNLRCAASDKKIDELAVKLREMTNLYEKADRDSKARAAELVKLGNNMDRY